LTYARGINSSLLANTILHAMHS